MVMIAAAGMVQLDQWMPIMENEEVDVISQVPCYKDKE